MKTTNKKDIEDIKKKLQWQIMILGLLNGVCGGTKLTNYNYSVFTVWFDFEIFFNDL